MSITPNKAPMEARRGCKEYDRPSGGFPCQPTTIQEEEFVMPRRMRDPLDQQITVREMLTMLRGKVGEEATGAVARTYVQAGPEPDYNSREVEFAVALARSFERTNQNVELTGDEVRRMPNVVAEYLRSRRALMNGLLAFIDEAQARVDRARADVDLNALLGPAPDGTVPAHRAPRAAQQRPQRQRAPITDPELLERRRQALAKARAARAEQLAAARAAEP